MRSTDPIIRYTLAPALILGWLLGLSPAAAFADQAPYSGWETLMSKQQVQPENPALTGRPTAFVECPESADTPDTFALCAAATCWTIDSVAYCKCDVLNQKSISIPFRYREKGTRKDVCDVLKAGRGNGFTVSTYATPRPLLKDYDPKLEGLGPPKALYTCAKGADPNALSAQCDGGLCFTSTRGQVFPGLGHLKKDEIICSCPIVTNSQTGFQIAGPWKCQPGDRNVDGQCCDQGFHDRFCGVDSTSRTGTMIAVGAATGVATLLSTELDGAPPRLNRCVFQ
jgi:hypothetical protein